MQTLGASIANRSGVELDVLALLAERAVIARLTRGGDRSCGGATRLLRASDGWFAVSLARPEDADAVSAWLEVEPTGEVWDLVESEVTNRTVATLVERARLLALPVAGLGGETPPVIDKTVGLRRPKPMADTLVVDLSSLWAGPLCGRVLALAGARVVKVESVARPDGARRGPAAFFELLNGGKEGMVFDFHDPIDMAALRKLIGEADVVIESSRPRALEHLDVRPDDNQTWLSITGYGRDSVGVAFGDDAAVGGGLVVWDELGPCFCVDAVADPLTGLVAADLCLSALERGRRGLIDVPLAGVAARFAGAVQ